jgi:hypothetical protein
MRKLPVLLFTLVTVPAFATLQLEPLPTYQYFYPCTSGVVDCNAFKVNYHGDYGLTNVQPVNWNLSYFNYSRIVSSNSRGEVLGVADPGLSPTYGVNGQLYCVWGCPDSAFWAITINENGLALFQFYEWPVLGKGLWPDPNQGMHAELLSLDPHLQKRLEMQLGFSAGGLSGALGPRFFAFGLNDQDQVLARITGPSADAYGVFSPTPIPEASTLALLASVLAAIAVARNRRALRLPQIAPAIKYLSDLEIC